MMIKVLVSLCLLGCLVDGQESFEPLESWNFYNFPHPINTPRQCGRPSPSFVCDPNGLMSQQDGNVIDEKVKAIYNETMVPRICYDTEGSKRKGYLVMVALLQKLQMRDRSSETYEDRFYIARLFSYIISKYKWRLTNCGEAVLVFYSREDELFYITTQPNVREKLSDADLNGITMRTLALYSLPWEGDTIFQAVNYAVEQIDEILRQ